MPLNPYTPISDQDRISPYNIDTISSRQVMRIKENIGYEIISWSNITFSELTSQGSYGGQGGELLMRSWEWEGVVKQCYKSYTLKLGNLVLSTESIT